MAHLIGLLVLACVVDISHKLRPRNFEITGEMGGSPLRAQQRRAGRARRGPWYTWGCILSMSAFCAGFLASFGIFLSFRACLSFQKTLFLIGEVLGWYFFKTSSLLGAKFFVFFLVDLSWCTTSDKSGGL